MARPSRIQFELQGIAHLLSDRDLHVPAYQRSYAWGEEQVSDFWLDLKGALDAGFTDYFLGTVVVADVEGESVIIDGQQRLATTTILLAALRDAYASRGDPSRAEGIHKKFIARFDLESATDVPRLVLNTEDKDFFEAVVIDGVSEDPEIDSHQRLIDAQTYFSRTLEEDLGASGNQWNRRIVDWIDFLDEGVKVIVIQVPELADAFVIFETLNDRGAPLTISDLLRNYLMSLGRDAAGLKSIQAAWSQVLLNLGLQQEENVFVDFLRQFWSSKHGAVREKELFTSIRGKVGSRSAALELAKELPEASRYYAALLDSKHELWAEFPPEAKASVEALIRLDLGQYRPLALAVLEKFDEQEKVRTLRALVSWAMRGLVVGGVGGGVTERAYCVAATRVRSGALTTATELLRQLIPIVPGDDEFETAFARARISRPGVARYVMASLERAARRRANAELVDGKFEDIRLQYVLPKTAQARQWPGIDADELRGLINRVGNLVLLSDEDPELAGNTFEERQETFAESTVGLTREVAEYERWDGEAIQQRQTALAQRAKAVWPRNPRR
jgi:hypothetical protein